MTAVINNQNLPNAGAEIDWEKIEGTLSKMKAMRQRRGPHEGVQLVPDINIHRWNYNVQNTNRFLFHLNFPFGELTPKALNL